MEAFHSPLDCVEPHLFVALERSFNTTHLKLQACVIKEIKFGLLLKLCPAFERLQKGVVALPLGIEEVGILFFEMRKICQEM